MRVSSRGNLTVQLIRQHRFGVDAMAGLESRRPESMHALGSHERLSRPHPSDARCPRVDKVQLSREVLASDAWAKGPCRAGAGWVTPRGEGQPSPPPRLELPPRTITPVVGSPALAGLGVALVVPGTLLDVVA